MEKTMIQLNESELSAITGGDDVAYGGVLAGGGAAGITIAGGLAVAGLIAGAAVASPVLIGALAVVSVGAVFEGLWYAF